MSKEQLYVFCWGNNPTRAKMKGHICRVAARGKMNSCAVRFVDDCEIKESIISRNALRKVKDE